VPPFSGKFSAKDPDSRVHGRRGDPRGRRQLRGIIDSSRTKRALRIARCVSSIGASIFDCWSSGSQRHSVTGEILGFIGGGRAFGAPGRTRHHKPSGPPAESAGTGSALEGLEGVIYNRLNLRRGDNRNRLHNERLLHLLRESRLGLSFTNQNGKRRDYSDSCCLIEHLVLLGKI
jgi:hypothetical protein